MPVSTLPHALRVMLMVLAWMSLPLWPVVIAGIWLFSDKGMIVAFGSEVLCTSCAVLMFLCGRVDGIVRLRTAELNEREQVLIIAMDRLSEAATQPQPVLRAVR